MDFEVPIGIIVFVLSVYIQNSVVTNSVHWQNLECRHNFWRRMGLVILGLSLEFVTIL